MPKVQFSIGWLILPVVLVTSWDIAVITDKDIQFLQRDKFVSIASQHLKDLASGSYDPVRGDLYVGDNNHQNVSVFRLSTFTSDYETGFIPVASKQQTFVKGIAFDPVSKVLFWSTGYGRTINKLDVDHTVDSKNTQSGVVLHNFTVEIPLGMAVDSCRQFLYWTNCNIEKPSIERSRIDGTERKVIISEGLRQPLGIVVDQQSKQIFWTDGREGIYFSIERSDLDGGNRFTIYHGTDHDEPQAITVAGNFIYWIERSEKNLWSLPKNKTSEDAPRLVKHFDSNIPVGVISSTLYLDINPEECRIGDEIRLKIEKNYKQTSKINLHGTIHDLAILSESPLLLKSDFCLNNGTPVNENGCKCPKGYSGPRCETFICQNYCINNGTCKVDQDSKPNCYCPSRYSGKRCEIDKCHGLCLNSGSCSIGDQNEAVCSCKMGFSGDRCEFLDDVRDELCKTFCQFGKSYGERMQSSTLMYGDGASGRGISEQIGYFNRLCGCSDDKSTPVNDQLERLADETDSRNQNQSIVPEPSNRYNVLVTLTLAALCIILALTVIYLSTKVYVLRKRPRIRKRIVVNKPLAPIMCRPQSPPDQCEITIENCCNMNICETPCFEPDFRSSKATFKRSKSEDKKMLINNSSQDEENY